MAVTKIWTVRDDFKRLCDYAVNPEKTIISDDLWTTLHYATRSKATRYDETRAFVHGIMCSDEHPYEDMMSVKRQFGKTGGNLAYHAYQSFKPGEVTPQECHEIGVQLARQLWGKRFQVVVATHMDKHHMHNHFVINSVSYVDGKKFDCSERTYWEFRRVSDALCKSRALSVIENPKGHTPRTIYFAEKRGEPTRHNLMREALDKAMSMSLNRKMLEASLLKLGYVLDLNPNRKYPTIRSVHSKKATRLYHLGEEYLPENMFQTVAHNPYQVRYEWDSFMYPGGQRYYVPPKRTAVVFKGKLHKTKPMSGVHALFMAFGYLLGVYPVEQPKRHHEPLSAEMKQALRRLDRYSAQVRVMAQYHLRTDRDVEATVSVMGQRIESLCKQRRSLYDKVSRAETELEKEQYRSEYAGLTEEIVELRKDRKIAKSILDDLPKMKEAISAEREMGTVQREIEARTKTKTKKRSYER